MLKSIPDVFISKNTLFRFISMNQESKEYKGYIVNFNTINHKNDLYYILEIVKIKDLGFLNSYIYIDVNKARLNLYLKVIFTINNL